MEGLSIVVRRLAIPVEAAQTIGLDGGEQVII